MIAGSADFIMSRRRNRSIWRGYIDRWTRPAAKLTRSPISNVIAVSYLMAHNRKITFRERNEAVRIVYRERKKNKRMRLHAYRQAFKVFPS